MITLYTRDFSAGTIVRCLLTELGLDYVAVDTNRADDGTWIPEEFGRLSPTGKVPLLIDGETVVYETGAVLLYLADAHPEAGLAPAVGSPDRAALLGSLFWITNNPMAALYRVFRSGGMIAAEAEAALVAGAKAEIALHGAYLDGVLAGREFLVGDSFTIADLFLAGIEPWCDEIDAAFGGYAVRAHRARVEVRPSVRQVYLDEGIPLLDASY